MRIATFLSFSRIFFRHFRRFRTTYLLHLTGLSVGLASALLIWLWVEDEWSIDRFHQNDSRLFRVLVNQKQAGRVSTTDGGGVLEEILKKEFPEVEYAVSTTPASWFADFSVSVNGAGNNVFSAAGNFVGKDYFKVFSYTLLQGSKESVLADKHSIVLSKKLALRLFHTTHDLTGKVVNWKWLDFSKPCVVTGVYEDFPSNSSYHFDFVVPLESWKDLLPPGTGSEHFDPSGGPFDNFAVLRQGTSIQQFNPKIGHFIRDQFPDSKNSLFLQKYSDRHLYGRYENGVPTGGRIGTVRLFLLIAVFILVMACINFMNLSTANASRRMKEVGVKKTLGAGRWALIGQFLGESLLTSFLALLIALLLVAAFLPGFSELTGKHLRLQWDSRLVLSLPAIAVITGLLAGSYPAFYLSRFRPAMTLKGATLKHGTESRIRRGLVVFQFSLSIIFIVAVIVVYHQIQYIQSSNPGYVKDNILYFEMKGRVVRDPSGFLSRLKRLPGVVNASAMGSKIILPVTMQGAGVEGKGKNANDASSFSQIGVDYDLVETLGIGLAEGRSFSRDFGSDSTAVLLNEAAVAALGLSHPVGKIITDYGENKRIIGVVKNFNFNSMHEAIHPFLFRLEPHGTFFVMVKIAAGKEGGTIRWIQELYKEFNPGFPLDYGFLDTDYQAQYASDRLIASLSKYFAGLAILISCLGLFGLAAFTAERRSKEIGMRKILGAGVFNIVVLLSAEFTKIVVLSLLIGLPLSYWITERWLDGFAYRISLRPGYFAAAALAGLLTAWGTIGIRTIRVALRSPLTGLKEGA